MNSNEGLILVLYLSYKRIQVLRIALGERIVELKCKLYYYFLGLKYLK